MNKTLSRLDPPASGSHDHLELNLSEAGRIMNEEPPFPRDSDYLSADKPSVEADS
jgi:hypothetical protein